MAYLPFIVDLPIKNAGSFQFVMGFDDLCRKPSVHRLPFIAVQTGFVVGFKGSKIFCLSLGKKSSLVQWLGKPSINGDFMGYIRILMGFHNGISSYS